MTAVMFIFPHWTRYCKEKEEGGGGSEGELDFLEQALKKIDEKNIKWSFFYINEVISIFPPRARYREMRTGFLGTHSLKKIDKKNIKWEKS